MQPRIALMLPLLPAAVALNACAPDYSPNTYAPGAVQQAAKVEPGVVVGVRQVDVAAAGTVGAATGGAAGGIAGSQTPGGVGSAFGALGGALVGGLVGSAVERSTADTTAFEYIVRKSNGDLVSVTQKDPDPLQIGQKVLVFDGKQARIVPDYTVPASAAVVPPLPPSAGGKPAAAAGATTTVPPTVRVESTPLAPPPGAVSPAIAPEAPPLAAPVPPPPLTPAAPVALAPPAPG